MRRKVARALPATEEPPDQGEPRSATEAEGKATYAFSRLGPAYMGTDIADAYGEVEWREGELWSYPDDYCIVGGQGITL